MSSCLWRTSRKGVAGGCGKGAVVEGFTVWGAGAVFHMGCNSAN